MPAKSAARRRLESLLSQQEGRVRKAFAQFLSSARSDSVMREVSRYLEEGDVEGALDIVDTYIIRMAKIIPKVQETAAEAEMARLAAGLASRTKIAISFDPGDPRTSNVLRQQSMNLIQQVSQQQREATRFALAQASSEGQGRQAAARAFRDSLGLTRRQEAAVRRYEELLRGGNTEALDRVLRDRRFDAAVRRAASSGEPLTGAQISKMVTRYRERFIAYRAETIARTETVQAVSIARAEAFKQTMAQVDIRDGEVERVWQSTSDARTRDTHRAMNGQTVAGMAIPFVSPSGARLLYPGDPAAPAEEVINCRCTVAFRLIPNKEAA